MLLLTWLPASHTLDVVAAQPLCHSSLLTALRCLTIPRIVLVSCRCSAYCSPFSSSDCCRCPACSFPHRYLRSFVFSAFPLYAVLFVFFAVFVVTYTCLRLLRRLLCFLHHCLRLLHRRLRLLLLFRVVSRPSRRRLAVSSPSSPLFAVLAGVFVAFVGLFAFFAAVSSF